MNITVEYTAQLKQATGTPAEQLDVPASCTVQQLALHLAERHGDSLRRLLLDADDAIQPSILLFVEGQQVRARASHALGEGNVVTLVSPISGG